MGTLSKAYGSIGGYIAAHRQAHGGVELQAGGHPPIVPIWLGDEAKAEQLALAVREEGIHVDAIRFPAVPVKSARLRIQLNAGHRRADIDHLVDVLRRHQHLAEPTRRFVAASRDRAWRALA